MVQRSGVFFRIAGFAVGDVRDISRLVMETVYAAKY